MLHQFWFCRSKGYDQTIKTKCAQNKPPQPIGHHLLSRSQPDNKITQIISICKFLPLIKDLKRFIDVLPPVQKQAQPLISLVKIARLSMFSQKTSAKAVT